MSGVRGSHHVLSVEHLLSEFGDGDGTVLLTATGGQWGEAGHEEMETGEWDHVDGELAQVGVELTGETERDGDTGHDGRDEVVQVAVRGVVELEGAHADVVESLRWSVNVAV